MAKDVIVERARVREEKERGPQIRKGVFVGIKTTDGGPRTVDQTRRGVLINKI